MIGLTVIAISILFLLGYLWLIRTTASYAKRKTGSNLIAGLAVVGLLLITFGDTLFRRWCTASNDEGRMVA